MLHFFLLISSFFSALRKILNERFERQLFISFATVDSDDDHRRNFVCDGGDW